MTEEDAPELPLGLAARVNRRFSFALHQNAVAFLLEITVANHSERVFEDISLELEAVPAFVRPRTWRIARLDPRQVLPVPVEDLLTEVEGGLLGRLTEAEAGRVTLTAKCGDAVMGQWASDVDVLARNQWGGMDPLPELVAAFVQPNDAAIDRILKQASDLLAGHHLPSSLDGYESGRRQRAWELVQAIWGAVCALGVAYALPPASFEEAGQKVRTPSQIWDGRVATCLDSTLLFAACLEQCHLHPLVIFLQGHAFVGCWLMDESLPVVVLDDPAGLRTRIQLGEITVFETTLATGRSAATLREAESAAQQELSEGYKLAFIAAVDIERARMQRILPLASPTELARQVEEPRGDSPAPAFEQAPQWEDAGDPGAPFASSERGRSGGILRWQGKLLDLTMRNRLLNFRLTRGALPLDAPDPAGLEDRLAEGRVLRLVPRPSLMGADPRNVEFYEQRGHEGIIASYAKAALERNEVTAGLAPEELTARLLALFRAARSSLQENGANTLYLAIGFLVWRKEVGGGQAYRAPLVLVPVNLARSSVRSGFRLSLGDEEPKFNQTLLEMLEREYRLSIPELREDLPQDDSGMDVRAVWRVVAERVKDMRGWEVVPEVVLSTFSFTKFLMWKDMVDHLEHLKRNRLVQHFTEATRESYPHGRSFPARHALDSTSAPATTYCPLPADSSQLTAVMAAASGQDFVLIGPPGTGKSQTITNLICHCLAEGRTVLFIAEKTAALDVVHRRLEAVGLGPFCLELHSNKASKIGVLDQLARALGTVEELPSSAPLMPTASDSRPAEPSAWEQAVAKVQRLRLELNDVAERLHTPHRNGLTIFEAVGRVLSGGDVPEVAMSWPSPETHDAMEVAGLAEQAARLDTYAAAAGMRPADPLMPVRKDSWSSQWQSALVETARRTMTLCARLEETTQALREATGLPLGGLEPQARLGVMRLAQLLTELARRGWAFVLRPDAGDLSEALGSALRLTERRHAVHATLSSPYDLAVARRLDLAALRSTLDEAGQAWWLRRWMLRRKVRRALTDCGGSTSAPVTAALVADVEGLSELRDLDRQLAGLEGLGSETNGLWRGLETDPDSVRQAQALTAAIRDALHGLAAANRHGFSARCLAPDGLTDLGRWSREGLDVLRRWDESVRALRQLMVAEEGFLAEDSPAAWHGVCTALLASVPRLQPWCAWQHERKRAVEAGLSSMVEAVEDGRVALGDARRCLDVNYCRWWLPRAVDADATLCAFVPLAHEARIADFSAADQAWLASVGGRVRTQLVTSLHTTLRNVRRGAPESRAIGVLQREVAKKKRHLPVRELLGQIQPVLPVLAPCLLMSPLSVAQYLSADSTPFDIVVFDEASQIPVWDAIGAIARGEQSVVVGDPKQLPPTTFFGRTEDDSEDDLDVDMESILDECIGADLPRLQLNWHYRSRHESLIAFSNDRYYSGTLVTFPSPVTDDHAVRYHHVPNGTYEKGASRTNPLEARAVADFVLARLRDPEFSAAGHSIGVVTFNAQQQHLIEDLFEQERERDETLERFFAETQSEPVFVKNLESVQGDERDVMCFSITYGPDAHGAVSMNFGPLNKQGGERRLNVAITRARRELHVFATLQPEQIDLNRTRAKGVEDLRRFLQYARRGLEVGAGARSDLETASDAGFVRVVCRALQSRGWQVQTDVGASQLRLDIGVVDPDVSGGFLAGIICDGPAGDAAVTARDRELLRQQLLEGLGWSVARTWSMEWWVDSDGALERLHLFLTSALATARESRSIETAVAAQSSRSPADGQPQDPEVPPTPEAQGETQPRVDPFLTATMSSAQADAGQFFERTYDDRLMDMIRQVVNIEGPIRADVLARRVGRVHGFSRTGTQISARISSLARKECGRLKEGAVEFFWPAGTRPGEWNGRFRRSDAHGRPVEEIALAELCALARACRGDGRGMEEGVRLMAHVAGLQRLRAPSRARLERAWRAEEARFAGSPPERSRDT